MGGAETVDDIMSEEDAKPMGRHVPSATDSGTLVESAKADVRLQLDGPAGLPRVWRVILRQILLVSQ